MSLRCRFLVSALVAFLAPASIAAAHDANGSTRRKRVADDRVRTPRRSLESQAPGGSAPVVVYLNGQGATLTAGWDDSSQGRSSIVWGKGFDSVTIPAFSQDAETWRRAVACVRERFAPYRVQIVDERPASGEYIMAMVGGEARLLGYRGGVGGVSPYNGSVMGTAIVFAFEQSLYGGADGVCEVTAHEIGHALGLDHVYLCEDLMSYLDGCGAKSFVDRAGRCGEYEERQCEDGQETQNSHRHLAQVVGLAGGYPEPEPEPEPEPDAEDDPDLDDIPVGAWDHEGPAIDVLAPEQGERFPGGSTVIIVVRSTDESGVVKMELGWSEGERVFECDDLPDDAPILCNRNGDLFVFTLTVGEGDRAFALRATDAAGNQTISDVYELHFGG